MKRRARHIDSIHHYRWGCFAKVAGTSNRGTNPGTTVYIQVGVIRPLRLIKRVPQLSGRLTGNLIWGV